jgi:hypothetical protein
VHIEQSEIKEIIFGCKANDMIMNNIINKILSKRNDVRFYKMNMVKGKYDLKREQIKV